MCHCVHDCVSPHSAALCSTPAVSALTGSTERDSGGETPRYPPGKPSSGGHAHAGPRHRAKEEAALLAAPTAPAASRRPEDTRCVVRVVTACGGRGVLLNIASRRAIRLLLARGQPPVLVRLEADLRDKGCKRGQLVVAEEG